MTISLSFSVLNEERDTEQLGARESNSFANVFQLEKLDIGDAVEGVQIKGGE